MKPSVGWALVGVHCGLLAALVVLPAGFLWSKGWIVALLAAVFVATGITIVVLAGLRLGTTLTPSPGHVAGWVALLGVLTVKGHSEKAMLQEKYPDYAQYQKVSGRFVPPWRSIFTRNGVAAES